MITKPPETADTPNPQPNRMTPMTTLASLCPIPNRTTLETLEMPEMYSRSTWKKNQVTQARTLLRNLTILNLGQIIMRMARLSRIRITTGSFRRKVTSPSPNSTMISKSEA